MQNLPKNFKNFAKFCNFLAEICQICSREDDFLVDFEKCCKMRIWTRKSASIQPRTSLRKSAGSWPPPFNSVLARKAHDPARGAHDHERPPGDGARSPELPARERAPANSWRPSAEFFWGDKKEEETFFSIELYSRPEARTLQKEPTLFQNLCLTI